MQPNERCGKGQALPTAASGFASHRFQWFAKTSLKSFPAAVRDRLTQRQEAYRGKSTCFTTTRSFLNRRHSSFYESALGRFLGSRPGKFIHKPVVELFFRQLSRFYRVLKVNIAA